MKQVGTIAIIGAMQTELDLVISKMNVTNSEVISGFEFWEGKLNGVDVVVAKCGIGKVFAAACTQMLIIKYSPELVINIGVAGALTDKLDIADVALATKMVQYDMDTTAIGDPLGLISGINKIYFECDDWLIKFIEDNAGEFGVNLVKGVFASADCFLNSKEKKKEIIQTFDAITCEMESGSIAQVCYVNNTRFGSIRTISDKGDENSGVDYSQCLEKACVVLSRVIDVFFKKISNS